MKKLFVVAGFALLSALTLISSGHAQNTDFPGVQKAMSPQVFDQAGLNKLSPEERARLDEFIRSYVSSSNQQAATTAVDSAVKNSKAMPPQVIESQIVGRFAGYNGRSRFTLANGQIWQQSQQDTRAYPPIDSPPVLILKEMLGYRMFVAGGGNVRVHKVN